jgi:ribosomal protein S18 acetylase RimI-like enzyme
MLSYELCEPTISNYEFLKQVHHLTLKQHVEKIWGWDEKAQDGFFKEDFKSGQIRIIRFSNQPVGYLQLSPQNSILHLVNILILPEFQNRKLGSTIIKDLIEKYCTTGKKLRLGVFKVNTRAKALYESLNFRTYDETETHYLMEFKPS